ncbi:MAG: ComEC family competence protein [Saprospirales bacterium]|nr:ComEC family competence protein [Saprospirales bacterium]MBK8920432.1 ComEC family competence protein [Saprospirales bacterium]
MHQRQIPFLRLFLPWAAGIVAGVWQDRPVPGLAQGLLAAAAFMLFFVRIRYAYRFRWVFGLLVAVVLFLAGYWHAVQYDERKQANHFSHSGAAVQYFTGIVYDAPSRGSKIKIPLRLEAAGPSAGALRPCSGQVLLFFEPTPASERLVYGDRLWIQTPIRPVEAPKNPDAFDYRRYLHFQNIHFQAFVKDRSYGVIATGQGHPLWRVAYRWRLRLLEVLRDYFPGRDEYAVASALLVGYKDELSEDLRASYAETGSMHALAVSGTHVGLLYAGMLVLLRRIPWRGQSRRWGETSLALAGIWAFALVTGATASVLRASVMFTLYLVSKAARRASLVWNILGASAFCLLILNPYLLLDAGFQLSYAAVAGMVFFYPWFQKITPPLPKWAGEGWKILLIGVAAQIGTLPLSLYYFHQFPVYFWLAGWVVVLGGAVFLWGGSILVLLSAVAPVPAEWLGWGLYRLVWGMNQLIGYIQHLPGSVVSGIWISAWAAVLLYLFVGALAGAIHYRQPRWLLAASVLLLALGVCRFGQNITCIHQRQVTLYHTNRHFLLDFFDGEKRYTVSDCPGARQERFAAQAHRWAHGIREAIVLPAGPETNLADGPVRVRPPVIQFHHKKFVLIDDSLWLDDPAGPPTPVDVLLVHNNPKIPPGVCLRQFRCRLVICSAANSHWRVERWKAACRKSGVPVFDVREKGAWVEAI